MNLHIPFNELGDGEKLAQHKEQILEAFIHTPENPDLYIIWASILLNEGKPREALHYAKTGIGFNPSFIGHYVTLAGCYQALGDDNKAFDILLWAYSKAKDIPAINWNLSLMLLQRGEWQLGYELYRWRKIHLHGHNRTLKPEWDRSISTSGQKLLVWCEQGLGDIVMMFRYIKEIKKKYNFSEIALEVPDSLYLLFSRHMEGLDGIYIRQNDFHSEYNFDQHCCLMDLPYYLGANVTGTPYLQPNPQYLNQWKSTITENELKGPNIGICWYGSVGHKNNTKRSAKLSDFAALGGLGNIFAVQQDRHNTPDFDIPDELKGMLNPTEGMINADFTTGLLANMDFVVTIDSFVAHLSGALGVKTYLILPYQNEWRWQTGVGKSIWYDSVEMIKQDKPGDWLGVMEKVKCLIQAGQH